ncbi:DUF397 domain-containing protein [Actinomadura flavalba]|uniref:DUF397 domain-containing protein n=1 Tax=Actinomadura flavalba TaxID=1120938 RepID=UPI0009DB7999|nr:DUF397 domain-containing protein [Actinomadura flavalba]
MNPKTPAWRKSSHSGPEGNHCVELANTPGKVAIRDTKNPTGATLLVDRTSFHRLTNKLRTL